MALRVVQLLILGIQIPGRKRLGIYREPTGGRMVPQATVRDEIERNALDVAEFASSKMQDAASIPATAL